MPHYVRSLASLYSWQLPGQLMGAMRTRQYRPGAFLGWFWQAADIREEAPIPRGSTAWIGVVYLAAGMLAEILAGVWLLIDWARFGTSGAWAFGIAAIIAYPLVWAHALAGAAFCYRAVWYVGRPKKLGRAIVCAALERQVRKLRRRHEFTVVAVAGAVGKTSTKLAIAELLGQTRRVRHQAGNYNDRVTVPLVFFGQPEPNILNAAAWFRIFRANARAIRQEYPYDVVVVELGTDGPGFMQEFAYVQPDLTVVTAITPEHMELFGTLDAVAAEELQIFNYSKSVLVNGDDIPGRYLAGRTFQEYSLLSPEAAYYAKRTDRGLAGQTLAITTPHGKLAADVHLIGPQGAKFALAAAAVADILGTKPAAIKQGLPKLQHFAGRMQILPGVHGSTLIDDTYNASPVALKAALDALYAAKSPQRIAILGSMNELGDYAPQAHREVGAHCDPKKLSLVVTIGEDARKYLAPAAKKAGCTVTSFQSPYEAGDYALKELKKNAVVLAKGSQNRVFTEEALKPLLADPKDAAKLVRQSPQWLAKKAAQFQK